jgi:hypothetical protein
MGLVERFRYAAYLAVVVGAIVGLLLALGSADAIGFLPSSAFDLMFSPMLMLALYLVAFAVAPWVAERLPIKRW